MFEFLMNHNLLGFLGVEWISQVMSSLCGQSAPLAVRPVHTHHGRHHRPRFHRCPRLLLRGGFSLPHCVFLRPHHRHVLQHGRRGRVLLQAQGPYLKQVLSLLSSYPPFSRVSCYFHCRPPLFFSSFNSSSKKTHDITSSQRNYGAANDPVLHVCGHLFLSFDNV